MPTRGLRPADEALTGIETTIVFNRGRSTDKEVEAVLRAKPDVLNLMIEFNNFPDRSLRHLRLSPLVKFLVLPECVSDNGLKYLACLKDLRELRIVSNKITDAGLEHFAKLPSLRHVSLLGAVVSAAAVSRLMEALPEATVFVDPHEIYLGGY